MVNTSFYKLKFKIIDLMTNYWVGNQLLTWWLVINLLAGQNNIANIIKIQRKKARARSWYKKQDI